MLVCIFLLSCMGDPKSDEAITSEAENSVLPAVDGHQYFLPAGNHITWIGTKPTGRHSGTIRISQGLLTLDDHDNVVAARFTMDMKDIKVADLQKDPDRHLKLTNHLKSEDFFDVANHPVSRFELTEIQEYSVRDSLPEPEETEFRIKDPNYFVTGNFSMRDTTLSISFPARIDVREDSILVRARFNIDRTLWGVSYRDEKNLENKLRDEFIHNKVNIGIDLGLKK